MGSFLTSYATVMFSRRTLLYGVKEIGVRVWSRFICLRRVSSGGLLGTW